MSSAGNGNDTPNLFPLRPRARILRTLGEELISSETVAVIELVKNSYDADAQRVLVRFSGSLELDQGCIEVIDNGSGMSMAVIQSAWMEPATYHKKKRPRSSKFKRRVLGEKGIGRFAASRLASELELITKQTSATAEIYVLFDWKQFDDESKYLDEILVLAEEREKTEICRGGAIEALWREGERPDASEVRHGTVLRMNNLKRHWAVEDIKDLRRGLSRLVSPFQKLSDFSIRLELPDQFADYATEIAPPPIIKYPHYTVKGNVDENGRFSFQYRVLSTGKKSTLKGRYVHDDTSEGILKLTGQTKDKDNDSWTSPTCGPFELELRIWDRDELGNVVQQVDSTITDVRRDLDSMAGVNIYRDGFRVLPYGEPRDDWLRLDLRRVQNPTMRLSNNQIVGFVSIGADSNPNLRDQSNREGLDENQALDNLREILIHVLSEIEEMRWDVRPRRKDKADIARPVGSLFESLDLDPLREHFKRTHPEDEDIPKIIDAAEQKIAEQIEEVQTVLARYHSLATLGQLIDVVLHDGRHPVGKIQKEALLGQEEIDKTQGNGKLLPRLRTRFATIENQGDILSTVFRRIEPFGGRRRGKPSQLYLEKIIADAVGVFDTEIAKLGVAMKLPKTETLVRVDAAEMQQVLTNLLQNSLYWLHVVEPDKRRIEIAVKRVASDHVEILFADSGPGVPSDHRQHIFEPYFSTRPNGVGLGLAIAGEIVSDFYDGKLELLDSGPLPGAVFRVSLRKRV